MTEDQAGGSWWDRITDTVSDGFSKYIDYWALDRKEDRAEDERDRRRNHEQRIAEISAGQNASKGMGTADYQKWGMIIGGVGVLVSVLALISKR